MNDTATQATQAALRSATTIRPAVATWGRLKHILCLDDFEAPARRYLPRPIYGYISGAVEEAEISAEAPKQIKQLEPNQLAVWISAAPEPQRSAMALFYLDEFSLGEIGAVLEVKAGRLCELISSGRRQFQAWLNSTVPFERE